MKSALITGSTGFVGKNLLRSLVKDTDIGKFYLLVRNIEKANPDTLFGIFGDVNWGNKERLSDETLLNLIEHFSSLTLSTKIIPDDIMGTAYEFLIKKFADDSGHTAAEFYTNRTVVRLMTLIMDPQPGETVYDPTCGSGGLLLNCALQLKKPARNTAAETLRTGNQPNHIRHCPHEYVYAWH